MKARLNRRGEVVYSRPYFTASVTPIEGGHLVEGPGGKITFVAGSNPLDWIARFLEQSMFPVSVERREDALVLRVDWNDPEDYPSMTPAARERVAGFQEPAF